MSGGPLPRGELRAHLDSYERDLYEEAVTVHRSKAAAATHLGIDRAFIERKLKQG